MYGPPHRIIIVLAFSLLISGCSIFNAHQCCHSAKDAHEKNWYTNYCNYYSNSITQKVLVFPRNAPQDTNRHPVLLLHELPGLTPQCLDLATNLAASGFRVYVPVMFGKPNESSLFWNTVRLSFSPSWHLYTKNSTPPIASELRRLIRDIDKTEGTNAMGVIGMCLSGSLPLALLSEPSVKAVVLSQPALPLERFTYVQRAALGLSASNLCQASNRVAKEGIPILGLRFGTDKICQAQRFETLQYEFGTNFVDLSIPQREYDSNVFHSIQATGSQPHSVLCESYDPSLNSPSRARFDAVVCYLNFQLKHVPFDTNCNRLPPFRKRYIHLNNE
jgi:dienelactone hydrolase